MADLFFFTELAKIETQTIQEGYGPVQGALTNEFRHGTKFELLSGNTKSNAFACTGGLLLVLPSVTAGRVNLILKPFSTAVSPLPKIKYFIYRGIDKNNFIDGSVLRVKTDPLCSQTLINVWTRFEQFKIDSSNPTAPNPTPSSIGHKSTLSNDVRIDDLFFGSDSDISAVKVEAGEYIGDFLSEVLFDVVIESQNLSVADVKKGNCIKDVDSLTGIEREFEKEKILAYVDSAILWNSELYDLIERTPAGPGFNDVPVTNDYSQLLAKYYSKNFVYLDIRTNNNYSYNYYQNYDNGSGSNLKFKDGSVASFPTPNIVDYSTEGWPIVIMGFVSGASSDNIDIELRIDDNLDPVLFSNGHEINWQSFLEVNILSGGSISWTNTININGLFVSGAVHKTNYIQLYYLMNTNPGTLSIKTMLKAEVAQAAFGNLSLLEMALDQEGQRVEMEGFTTLTLNVGVDFTTVAKTGTVCSPDRVLFYTVNSYDAKSSGIDLPLSSKENEFIGSFKDFPVNLPELIKFSISKYEIDEGGSSIDILLPKESRQSVCVEDSFFLGITKIEAGYLQEIIGLSDYHEKIIHLEKVSALDFLTDTNGLTYKKYEVKLQGWDPVSGNRTIVSHTNPVKKVYVYAHSSAQLSFIFSSANFALAEGIVFDNINLENVLNLWGASTSGNFFSDRVFRLHPENDLRETWEIMNFDGSTKTYEPGEADYEGTLIAGNDILLPIGTRVVAIASSKFALNNSEVGFYAYCFHNGKYREGLIYRSAFVGQNENLQKEIETKKRTYPEDIIGKAELSVIPFLDDVYHVVDYFNRYEITFAGEGTLQQFSPIFTTLKNNLSNLISSNSPITNKISFSTKLQSLNNTLNSTSPFNNSNVNLVLNNNVGVDYQDIPDTFERWVNYKLNPIHSLVKDINSISGLCFVPITPQWIKDYIDPPTPAIPATSTTAAISATPGGAYFDQTLYDICHLVRENGYNLASDTLNDATYYFETGSVYMSADPIFKDTIKGFKEILNHVNMSATYASSADPIINWFKSKSEAFFDSLNVFIVTGGRLTTSELELGVDTYKESGVLIDNSVGYIDSIRMLSNHIHEINMAALLIVPDKVDTHISAGEFVKGQKALLQHFIQNDEITNYLENINHTNSGVYEHARNESLLFFNPILTFAYLDFYLKYLQAL